MIELDVLSAADLAADDDARAAHGKPLPWRSAADRAGAPGMAALRHHEFQSGAAPEAEDAETSRRTFLKVMGASAALAGLTGCRRPVETIVPYARKPQEVIPGVPNYFATAMPFGGVGKALLVQSHEGRPVKVEGNPEHPVSQGASDAFAQASVLQMYDPDRSRHAYYRDGAGEPGRADWARFVAATPALRGAGRMVVLAEPTSSPTLLDAPRAPPRGRPRHAVDHARRARRRPRGARPPGRDRPARPPDHALLRGRRRRLVRRRLPLGPARRGLERPRVCAEPQRGHAPRRGTRADVAPLRRRVHDDDDGRHGGPPPADEGGRRPALRRDRRPRARRRRGPHGHADGAGAGRRDRHRAGRAAPPAAAPRSSPARRSRRPSTRSSPRSTAASAPRRRPTSRRR